MPPIVIAVLCAVIFFTHAWLMLGHRQKMGADPQDRPQDPLFTAAGQYVSFGAIMAIQLLASYRSIRLAYGTWTAETPLEKFCDFLALPNSDALIIGGLAVFCLGLGLRIWAIRILGRLFTFEIGIRPEHKIVEEGPYRFVRHPSYTGYIVLILGMGLIYTSLFATLGMLSGTLIFLWMRMNHEEAMLKKHFGKPYEDYIRRSKRLFPFVY